MPCHWSLDANRDAIMNETEDTISDESGRVPALLKWLETLLVTVLFLTFSLWQRPEDPFYLTGNFPWLVLAPLLAGLRYGFMMALIASLVIIASLGFYLRMAPAPVEDFPYVWAVGVLIISLLAGEFRDYWERQRQKLALSNDYRGMRLEEFTRNYYLLKVSHDRLEQQLAGSSNSLREALRRLYAQLGEIATGELSRETASLMLQLLVRYGQLQVAGIYAVNENQLKGTPLATIGRFREITPNDPLLQHALEERRLVSVQAEFQRRLKDLDTDLLAAIPLIDSEDQFIGVCVIESMPFFSFETRSLQLLSILAGHMADALHQQSSAEIDTTPQWQHFRHHLARVARDAESFNLPGAMVGLRLEENLDGQRIAEHIQKIRRGLDVIAEYQTESLRYIVVLMPLTDELGLAGYLQRLEDGVHEQQGTHLNELALIRTLQIKSHTDAESWLDTLFAREKGGSDDQ